ncbi:PREDICTED: juvenile hormone acid O-methyltransferase-like [Trachymyrmex cornetzi]|uniref:Putative methyltransferase yqeM n=1 Tax=Trachymyrmex cornetzi TaxID=471704 RepID=A0A195EK28_9HYME|nr:PREDICTED: juvenile hormone acid O-methyltransferase-like [Trachymyrmex cornetzi]KYN28219.1 Putative methyltransferase yqeM [Trachymyrmex cornetzi]
MTTNGSDTNKHFYNPFKYTFNYSNPFKYTLNNKLQREKASAVIDEFEEHLKSISGKCLDIGCGPGDITKDMILPALDPNAVVIGTDVSKNMIDYANKKYSIPKKLEYDVLDAQTKNLPTKYLSEFDFIFSFNTLHWCNDIKQTFENIYRMLQPNGTMLILFVASHKIFKVLEKLANDARFTQHITDLNKYMWPFQKSVNPRKELKELLETVGFTVNHCSHRESFHFDENPDRFFSSIASFLDFIEDMPYDKKEEFKKEFVDKYAKTQIICKQNDQNTVLEVYRVLMVFAQKRMP